MYLKNAFTFNINNKNKLLEIKNEEKMGDEKLDNNFENLEENKEKDKKRRKNKFKYYLIILRIYIYNYWFFLQS